MPTRTTDAASRVVFLHDADVLPGPVGALLALADQVELDIPRHPGFGEHDDLAEEWDGLADLALWHLRRLDEMDGPPVHLVGAGFGGWLALELAVRRPRQFVSLTLISPYGVKLSGTAGQDFADVLLLDAKELVELGWADPARFSAMRMPGFPADGDDEADARAFAARAGLARYGWKPFLYDPRLRRWLSVIDVPTLVISGDRDGIVSSDHSRAVAELIPGARFTEIADCGHYPYLEQPEQFVRTVTEFIAAVAADRSTLDSTPGTGAVAAGTREQA